MLTTGERLALPPENQHQVVGRHADRFLLCEALGGGAIDDRFQVSDPPGRITRAQAGIERGVAVRRVCAVLFEGTVKRQHPVFDERYSRPGHQPQTTFPRRDMEHVGGHDAGSIVWLPIFGRDVEGQRRADVGGPGLFPTGLRPG